MHYQQVTDCSKLGTANKLTVACVFLWLHKLEKWAERNPVKFNKVRGKVLHQECNNPTQQYRLGTNWLAAGGQLTYKIAQAGIFFLEVHSARTRGNRPQHETWEILTQYREKKFYYEGGQRLEQVLRAVVESPPWRHVRPIWTQSWTTFSTSA